MSVVSQSTVDFYWLTRARFPDAAAKADRECMKMWNEAGPELAYSWFHGLANTLNREMNKGADPVHYRELLEFINSVLRDCDKEVRNCIDVSFVENLFWQVPAERAESYWQSLPGPIKQLYLEFHSRPPS